MFRPWGGGTRERSRLDRIEDAIEAIAAGGFVVVVDDPSRENEGDIVFAAQFVDPEKVNWLAKEARGLICVAMRGERLDDLAIPPMARRNGNAQGTAFHVSVDASEGVTTGISAADRARTISALADPTSGPRDFARPGHIFPLAACSDGVMGRDGHTEAGTDLCRLAGVAEAAVICEICAEDGEMARLPALRALADQHALPLVSIADLIAFRHRRGESRRRAGRRPIVPRHRLQSQLTLDRIKTARPAHAEQHA